MFHSSESLEDDGGDDDPDDAPRRRGSKKTKKGLVSSYKVFSHYIRVSENVVDVTDIFSKSCFEEWMASRPGQILHPEQSFQRVLYAHIRGADHRKPFPPKVEASLLEALRCPKRANPWKDLFGDNIAKVGIRGFKRQGFHEARSGLSDDNASSSDQNCKPKKVNKKKRSEDEMSDIETALIQSPKPARVTRSTVKREEAENVAFSLAPCLNQFFSLTVTKPTYIEQDETPWDAITRVIQKYVKPERRYPVVEAANARGINYYSPAVYFMLHEKPSENDLCSKFDFLVPPEHERRWLPDRPLAKITFAKNGIVTGEDAAAIEIFGGSIMDKHMYELKASYVVSMYAMIAWLPEFGTTGKAWRRELVKKCDGSTILCLEELAIDDEGEIIYLQDISDLYPEVLDIPHFV